MTIGRLQKVPLRELWAREATGFSAWLAENIDVLGDELDLSISEVVREKRGGDFPVDILGIDDAGTESSSRTIISRSPAMSSASGSSSVRSSSTRRDTARCALSCDCWVSAASCSNVARASSSSVSTSFGTASGAPPICIDLEKATHARLSCHG